MTRSPKNFPLTRGWRGVVAQALGSARRGDVRAENFAFGFLPVL